MKGKLLLLTGVCLFSCAIIAGCNKGSDIKDISDSDIQAESSDDGSSGNTIVKDPAREAVEDSDLNLNGMDIAIEVDLSSEDLIREFLAGEWTMIDMGNRKDYATLSIRSNGSFDFTRLKDHASGYGKIGFENQLADKDDEPDYFRLEFEDLNELVPADRLEYEGSQGPFDTGGIFRLGMCEDRDYLYLKEIGNGDTMISLYALNTGDANDPEDWSPAWLFYRDKVPNAREAVTSDESFYAWAWERDSDGVWLQPMTVHEYETEDEYTGRRYTGAYFSEQDDIRAMYYRIDDRADLDGLLDIEKWCSEYPLMMYKVSLNNKGKISEVTEVDQSYYNIYDLGDIDPEFSYEGTTFTINGFNMDIHEVAPAATAIMDCTRVGDWIIVECHVNPHSGIYEFYNINSGNFEYEITGANLLWRGDDLSTAVYSNYNQVYDFWGNLIGSVDEGEVFGLEWLDDETVGAECMIVDSIGREKEFTYKLEYRPQDKAVLKYYEYLLGGSRQWRRFRDEIPDAAAALVIVNPPARLLDRMPAPLVYDVGAYDRLVVVSLMDGMRLYVDAKTAGESKDEKYWGKLHDAGRGDATVFQITVPEGAYNGTLVLQMPNSGKVLWDIAQISGESAVMSKFLTVN